MKLGNKKWWIGGIIVGAIIVMVAVNASKPKDIATATVQRTDLKQTVSVSGNVKAASEVELGLPTGGRVSQASVKVGDRVTQGQVLVALEQGQLGAQVRQAQAGVLSAQATLSQYQAAVTREQAKLDELLRGSLPEEVAIKKAELAKAEQDLENYYSALSTTLSDAYNKADDAVRVKTSAIFTGNINLDYSLTFDVCNSQAEINANTAREQSELDLIQWLAELNQSSASNTRAQWDLAVSKARIHLQVYNSFLIALNAVLTDSCLLNNTTYDTYRTNVSAARTTINTASTNLNAAEQDIASQKIVVGRIENELDLTLAGTPSEQISGQRAALKQAEANLISQQAQVQQAQANVQSIQAQLGQGVIRAPFAGLVTKQEAKVGQIATAGMALVSLISDKKFQVEANIAEVDVAKVSLQDVATITLDAYDDDSVFTAIVVAIDPTETLVDGLSTYRITLEFTEDDQRVKSGMTANIVITTDEKTGVLAIPSRAISYKGTSPTVTRLNPDNQMTTEIEVSLGLRASDGQVEIVSGLDEGDAIIIP